MRVYLTDFLEKIFQKIIGEKTHIHARLATKCGLCSIAPTSHLLQLLRLDIRVKLHTSTG
jgi:hypothetical protein